MVWTSAKKHINCFHLFSFIMFFYHVLLFYRMPIFNLHDQLLCVVRYYVNIGYIKTRTNVKSSIAPEEGWFGQPKYSTPSKNHSTLCRFLLLYTSHWEFSISCITQECDNVTTPYHPISALLSGKWPLKGGSENFKLLALKVIAAAYERWSLTRGSKYRDLT